MEHSGHFIDLFPHFFLRDELSRIKLLLLKEHSAFGLSPDVSRMLLLKYSDIGLQIKYKQRTNLTNTESKENDFCNVSVLVDSKLYILHMNDKEQFSDRCGSKSFLCHNKSSLFQRTKLNH